MWINKEINKFKSSGNVGLPLRGRFALCAYRRWMAQRSQGGGTAYLPPPHSHDNGRDYSNPVRRQKCHNNGPRIVFAAPLQILGPSYVTTRRSPFSYWEIGQFYSCTEKARTEWTRIRLCHFKHLISIASGVFRCMISAWQSALRIQRI